MLKKLQAGVAAVIGDDINIINKAKELYFSNQTIYQNAEDDKNLRKINHFYKFI